MKPVAGKPIGWHPSRGKYSAAQPVFPMRSTASAIRQPENYLKK